MDNKADELSHALQQMQVNLKRISEEHSERLMLQRGRNTLNEKLQGDKTLPELSKDIIDFLISYSIAQVGSLYVFEEGALHLQYACGIKGQAKASFQVGEGLVGQAASEKALKVYDKIPKTYFKMLSSFGEEKPDAIAVVPSFFDNKIIAVIELGKFGAFSPIQLKLLEEISEPVAIAINSLLVKRDMEKLITQLNTKEQELNNRIKAINKSNGDD